MMKKLLLISLIFLVDKSLCDRNDKNLNQNQNSVFCTDLKPQSYMDEDMIMGMWYGSEVISHFEDGDEFEAVYDSCVVIHLAEVTNDFEPTEVSSHRNNRNGGEYHYSSDYGHTPRLPNSATRYLRLIWDERGKTLEYTLRFNNSRRGFWISSGPQSGTMLDLPYNQFSGTIQVMKAVGNHLVLTFCQSLPKSQLFSIILSRQPQILTREDIQSVRNLLRRRGLSLHSVRKVCRNGSSTAQIGFMTLIVLAVVSFLSKNI